METTLLERNLRTRGFTFFTADGNSSDAIDANGETYRLPEPRRASLRSPALIRGQMGERVIHGLWVFVAR